MESFPGSEGFPGICLKSLTKCLFMGFCQESGFCLGNGVLVCFARGGFLQIGPSKNGPYRPLIKTFWEANDRPNKGPILTCLCTPPHGNDIFYPTFALHPEIHFFQIPGEGGPITLFRNPDLSGWAATERFSPFFTNQPDLDRRARS